MRKIKFRTTYVTRDERGHFVPAKNDDYDGYFHKWMWDQHGQLYGICELENGTIMKIYYEQIVFMKDAEEYPRTWPDLGVNGAKG